MEANNNKKLLGTAIYNFDTNGNLDNVGFKPNVIIDTNSIKIQTGKCETIDEVKESAKLLLGAWFNHVNEIELRDMEKTTIELSATQIVKHGNGKLAKVVIEYILTER
jgi:hypothetical protein